MKKIYLLMLVGFTSLQLFSQTSDNQSAVKEYEANIYGFVRTDYIWDTRKSAQVREYHLNLYPLDELLDTNKNDLNAAGASNFLSLVTRFGVKMKGPNVWGAKMTGTLEGDFFGNTEASIGLLRLRHAYANMEWNKTSITMGQTWYPTFIPEVFPGVANFSTGILFNPFGWASQIRVKQNITKNITFAVTAYKEREFTTATAVGGTQNSASFNSALPTLHGQFQFKNKNLIAGLGAEYKTLQPLTISAGKVSTEKVISTSFVAYFKYSHAKFSLKAYGITGTDMYNLVMLGGFNGYTLAGAGQQETYKPTKTSSFWLDLESSGKKIAPALFLGYSKNEGADKSSLAAGETVRYYTRGMSGNRVVDNVWRISARVDFKQNKLRITPELEYTAATWGDLKADGSGNANANKKEVGNYRMMVSCVYSF